MPHERWENRVQDILTAIQRIQRYAAGLSFEAFSKFQNRPCACEWYLHMAGLGGRSLEDVGRDTLRRAIHSRRHHRGFMAEYTHARALVDRTVKTGQGPLFASWF